MLVGAELLVKKVVWHGFNQKHTPNHELIFGVTASYRTLLETFNSFGVAEKKTKF